MMAAGSGYLGYVQSQIWVAGGISPDLLSFVCNRFYEWGAGVGVILLRGPWRFHIGLAMEVTWHWF